MHIMRALIAPVLLFVFALNAGTVSAKTLRIAYLQYGTVHWELNVIERHQLFQMEGVQLELVPAASHQALNVMLLAGRVDMIVGDWIWVSHQRAVGRSFTGFPYSLAEGELFLSRDNESRALRDFKGKTLGIAGGETNKNWLIARAYGQKELGIDLTRWVSPRFVAPPLLNELLLRGKLDGGLNFWHYSAQLESAGLTPLLTVDDMLSALSIKHDIPLLVWIFNEPWAAENSDVLGAFLDASYLAKRRLRDDDQEWNAIASLMRVDDSDTLSRLQSKYRLGIPQQFGHQEKRAASQLYSLLNELDKTPMTQHAELSEGTFYDGYQIREE